MRKVLLLAILCSLTSGCETVLGGAQQHSNGPQVYVSPGGTGGITNSSYTHTPI